METDSVSRRYETRGNAKAKEPVAKSRVDWRLTKSQRQLDDSEEEEEEEEEISSASEKDCETSSEGDLNEERSEDVATPNTGKNEAAINTCGLPSAEPGEDNPGVDYTDEENISVKKRRRSHTLVMYDSDDSDDSDIVRKVFSKRRCIIDEEDAAAEQEQRKSFEEEERTRKQKRQKKLQELSRRRSLSTSNFSESHEDSEDDSEDETIHSVLTPTESSGPSECDSMKDFIVEEEEGEEAKEEDEGQLQREKRSTLLEKHIPRLSRVDHFVHFQRVVKAFLINAFDDSFLASLYAGKRQKRYAQEMLTSLHYLDDRFIQPRLDNLLARSRWKERYKDRVDSYPDVRIVFERAVMRSCEACELQRYCTVKVILSGNLYSSETLEADNFMFQDKQVLKVGAVCGNRTQVYHSLKHFKYKLYRNCCDVMKTKGFGDEPVKDSVERAFRQLDDEGWIRKQYTDLEDCMDNADYFHEEKI